MHGLGDVFGELFAQRGAGRVNTPGANVFSKHQTVIDAVKAITAPEPVQDRPPAPPPPESPAAPPVPPELARISEIFRANGETLELIENRLKAKSGMDYVRRLTYLFLYAHELHGRAWTPKVGLTDVLREAKVWDANTRAWLKGKKGFRVDPEDRVQLIQGGRDEAKKALNEALDPNVTDDWNPDKKSVTKRGPRKKAN